MLHPIEWADPRAKDFDLWVESVIRLIVKHGDHVLDVGCGNGRLAQVVNECGGVWHGCDLKDQPLHPAASVKRFWYMDCLGTEFPFASESFQVVVGVLVCNELHLSQMQFRNQFVHLASRPGKVVSLEAAETYIWARYPPDTDHLSESIRRYPSGD